MGIGGSEESSSDPLISCDLGGTTVLQLRRRGEGSVQQQLPAVVIARGSGLMVTATATASSCSARGSRGHRRGVELLR